MKRAEGYTMHVYCINAGKAPNHLFDNGLVEYYGSNRSDVYAQARADGWTLHRDGTSTCSKCNNSV